MLVAEGLEKRFGAFAALRGIDFTLPEGETLAILGPNGAGKSTLLRLLAGLSNPTAGALLRRGGASKRVGVGYLGHATLLYPELSARENLIFAARLQRLADAAARADRLLEEEGLQDAAHRLAGTFSRGMSQRLSIARARIHDPSLLLLDEPYTGLDATAAERLSGRLRGLKRGGRSLVLVTHDLHQASQLADAALVLRDGRVVHRARGEDMASDTLAGAYAAAVVNEGGAR